MLNKIDELKLVVQCALTDNRDAFGQLVEAYQSDIRRFFLNLTNGDTCLSDDLAQETFIKAYIGIRSFRGLSKFSTWLYRIAYNEFYAWARSRREDVREQIPDTATASIEKAENTKMDVESALKLLSDAERSVVVLFYLEDRSLKDVSKITGMPEGTVKSHIARAKPKLAKILG